jgi:hypothetical protein
LRAKIGTSTAAYALFLLIGLVTFRFHWHALFDLDRSGLLQPYLETLLLVPILALLAFVCSVGSSDKMLRLLVIATVAIIAVQVLVSNVPGSQPATDALNAAGRVYTVLCLVGWPAGRILKRWKSCLMLLAALGLLIVPLSLAWNVEHQALTVFRRSPGPLEVGLYDAAEAADLKRVQALLAAGARPDVKGDGGWDALMHAASGGDPAVIKELLMRGADPNTREDKGGWRWYQLPTGRETPFTALRVQLTGRTALMTAAVLGHSEAVRELLAAGAHPGLRDIQGKTALDWAESTRRADIVRLLRSAQQGG